MIAHPPSQPVAPQPSRSPHAESFRHAFTLVELLVAISVLSLMMTLAAKIFFDAQKGVQRGLQTSQIIAESRSISQPLTEDVRKMNVFLSKYGTNSPGFLIIHQNSFGGVLYPDPNQITDDTSTWIAGTMRSDQIGFFRDANGLKSLTPGEDSRYDSDAKARHARIWYGHASPIPDPVTDPSLDPGDPEYNLASQMILGRQALLLIENDSATTFPGGRPGDSSTLVAPEGRVASAAGGVNVNTYTGLYDALDLNTFVRGATHSIYDDQGVDPASTPPYGLFRTPTYSVSTTSPSLFGSVLSGPDGLPNATYANLAAEWLYRTAGERLQARTSIDNDFSAGIFQADEIAQLHAAFAPHVADFAIEIACDWIDDWDDTTTPGTRVVGAKDGHPDYEPDRDGFGNIKWYTLIRPNPDADNNGVGDNYPSEPVTYWANITVDDFDGTGTAVLPAHATGNNPFVYDYDFIFSHTGDDNDLVTPGVVDGCGKYWPYLIRFRYRLMDGKGEFRTIETNPDSNGDGTADDPEDYTVVGRWFEQVVPVPRPQGLY